MKPLARIAPAVAAAALLLATGCNFEDAYRRYCSGNAACEPAPAADAGADTPAADAGQPDPGGRIEVKSCADNAGCTARAEVCDARGHVCVPTCHTAADCPPGLTACEHPDGHGTVGVCRCSGAASCAQAVSGSTCSPIDHLCETLCTSPEDCAEFDPPRFCDATTGACLLEPIECTGHSQCTTAQLPRCDLTTNRCTGCRSNSDCSTRTDGLNDCNPMAGACVPFNTCNPANPAPGPAFGPDACRYGQICEGTTCAPIDNGDCYGAEVIFWNRFAGGPVIVRAIGSSSPNSAPNECPRQGSKISAEIDFYAPYGFTYGSDPNSSIWFQSGVAGTQPRPADFVHDVPASGAKFGHFTAGVCAIPSVDAWSVYLWSTRENHREHGNVMCLR